VSKTDEYAGYALALLEMAERAPSAVQKQRLLSVAEGCRWRGVFDTKGVSALLLGAVALATFGALGLAVPPLILLRAGEVIE
jgi:hypothetical protein